MKKVIMIAASLMIGAFAASAGEKCCPMAGMAKKAAASKECGDMTKCGTACLDAVEMTAEQKEQLASWKAECEKDGCDETSAKKMTKGLGKILTADQMATLKDSCKEKGCWQPKTDS